MTSCKSHPVVQRSTNFGAGRIIQMTTKVRAQKVLGFATALGADFKQIPLPYKVVAKVGEKV